MTCCFYFRGYLDASFMLLPFQGFRQKAKKGLDLGCFGGLVISLRMMLIRSLENPN